MQDISSKAAAAVLSAAKPMKVAGPPPTKIVQSQSGAFTMNITKAEESDAESDIEVKRSITCGHGWLKKF
mgnify:CR=1 FL=1